MQVGIRNIIPISVELSSMRTASMNSFLSVLINHKTNIHLAIQAIIEDYSRNLLRFYCLVISPALSITRPPPFPVARHILIDKQC